MKLFIANTTKQNHEFVWRPKLRDFSGENQDGIIKPKYGELRRLPIPLGGQICIGNDKALEGPDVKNILEQHPHIVRFEDLNTVRGFQGLCYRQDNPVPIEEILERLETNDKVRTEENKQRQTNTALQIASNMREVAAQDDAPFKDLRETDVQVAEKGAQEVNGNTPRLNNVVEVAEEGKTPSGRGRKSAA
jgi:DNA-binding protein H-NS